MRSIFAANRTALVTGASAGIGLELTRALAGKLDAVIVVARRSDRLEQVAKEIQSRNPKLNVAIEAADLSDPEAVQNLLRRLEARRLGVDVLSTTPVWVNLSCSKDHRGAELSRLSKSTLSRCSDSHTIFYQR